MKKYKMLVKDFDGLIIYYDGENLYWNAELYKEENPIWISDTSRYFLGWFPLNSDLGNAIISGYHTKIIKIK